MLDIQFPYLRATSFELLFVKLLRFLVTRIIEFLVEQGNHFVFVLELSSELLDHVLLLNDQFSEFFILFQNSQVYHLIHS